MAGSLGLSRVTVFAGSVDGNRPEFRSAVTAMGCALAEAGIGVACGGGVDGLMGALTASMHATGGEVVGVVPQMFATDPSVRRTVTVMEVVPDLRARKQRMADLGDAFVALPGGLGTLDELIEVWALEQLRVHSKPVALLNTSGYWDPFLAALAEMAGSGFLSRDHASRLVVEDDPACLVARLRALAQSTGGSLACTRQ